MNTRYTDLVVTQWYSRFMGRTFACSTGKGGIGDKRCEGDSVTPAGIWRIEYGYYRCERLIYPSKSVIPFYPVRFNAGWSDDINDTAYNTPVNLPHTYSTERLCRADNVYNYILVMNYNRTPIITGQGSAVFIHCWRKPRHPTEGCVAFAPHDLRWICDNWQSCSRVVILPE